MTTPFPADDCYITWTFQHLGAYAVVRASAACKQWRKPQTSDSYQIEPPIKPTEVVSSENLYKRK